MGRKEKRKLYQNLNGVVEIIKKGEKKPTFFESFFFRFFFD